MAETDDDTKRAMGNPRQSAVFSCQFDNTLCDERYTVTLEVITNIILYAEADHVNIVNLSQMMAFYETCKNHSVIYLWIQYIHNIMLI